MSARTPTRGAEPLGPRLERLLAAFVEEHARMEGFLAAQREALRTADAGGVSEATRRQRECASRIAALEQDRRELVALHAGGLRGETPTLSNLARLLDPVARERCLALAAELRASMGRVARESGVVRQATRSLLSHVHGVMAQVGRCFGDPGTYGARGSVGTAGAATLDVVH